MKQKFIMEFLTILLLSFAIGSSLPAAVSEDSNEPNVSIPLTDISSPKKDMQRYIQDLRKQKPSDTVTMKKYIKAYSSHHDDYQQSEETKSDKIAKQNNETIRLHPELIPFEISDAKVPDTETLKLIERSKEERKIDNLKEEKVLVKKDMSTAESVMLKITHPGPSRLSARPRSIQQLPVEVQNAINFFVQKENSQKLPSSKYSNPSQSYKTLGIPSKNWWLPLNVKSHSITTPLVLNPQLVSNFSPSTKYTYVPSPTYKKFQPSEQNLQTQLPQLQQLAKPVDVLYTFKTDHQPVYTSPTQLVFGEHKYSNSLPPEKLLTKGNQNLVYLTSLIGKTPDLQVQGLGDILEKQEKYYTEKPSIRPQDSTSPVLFPLSARLPKPRPATEKPLFVVNAVSYSTTSAPEVSSKSFIYNELKPHFKNTHLLSSTYFNTKDYIPISENTADNLPNKNVFNVESPRPVYVAPTLEKAKDTKNFKRNFGRPSDQFQYASGYAFGYRVRDSHTGNDYGHTQNRDTDGITRGEYHIRLPDGRIQNVKYTADEKGFHADLSYQSGN